MTQVTAFGEAELECFGKVDRASGQTEFFRVVDGENVEISQLAYMENTGICASCFNEVEVTNYTCVGCGQHYGDCGCPKIRPEEN